MFWAASISIRASACASFDKGTWTAIWSPSKSALNAVVTRGWRRIARPSTKIGSNAWIPSLWRVGARLSNTGCSRIISSKISHTWSSILSIWFLAFLMLLANSRLTNSRITNGLNNSSAISLGNPHWYIFKFGPTTITERPE